MSEDLIRRSDAIKAVQRTDVGGIRLEDVCAVTDAVTDAINAIPTIEPKRGEWISCSERLPSEECFFGTYLISVGKYTVVTIAEYKRGKWFLLGRNEDVTGDVIAWMPLPEPYCGADMRDKDDE